ncbi:MAG: hypothetical protein HC910_17350 [Spirulinaceae cyanobacterium SM2_1_0]|nr:hypothetical protein [Spirulinaceae cyanobacterium SM2_1_0]
MIDCLGDHWEILQEFLVLVIPPLAPLEERLGSKPKSALADWQSVEKLVVSTEVGISRPFLQSELGKVHENFTKVGDEFCRLWLC